MSILATGFIAFVALAGLIFILLVPYKRRTSRGTINAPAPGSPDSPLFGQPKEKPKK